MDWKNGAMIQLLALPPAGHSHECLDVIMFNDFGTVGCSKKDSQELNYCLAARFMKTVEKKKIRDTVTIR
jgi:hypothetical protein